MAKNDDKKGEVIMTVPIKKKRRSDLLLSGKSCHPSEMTDEQLREEGTVIARRLEALLLESRPVVDEIIKRFYGNVRPSNEELLHKFMERHQAGFAPKKPDEEVWN